MAGVVKPENFISELRKEVTKALVELSASEPEVREILDRIGLGETAHKKDR